MTTSTFVFNQYYIDLLKKLKDISKKHKGKSETAKTILSVIKENYLTLDKSSDEYINFLNENVSEEIWSSYMELDINDENMNDWFKENGSLQIYNNITLNQITRVLRDNYLCHHYCTVFYVFKHDLEKEETEKIVKILQSINNKDLLDEIKDENIKKIIKRLEELRNKTIKDKSGIDMKGIEDTSLGKLAKEILEEIDIEKLQKSMGENGDVLKAISDPDSGFSDLISNVSKKMATKMANGELKQENLLQDAMKFASLMPGMFGGGPGSTGGAGGPRGGMPDMSAMMNMMGSMMGNKQSNNANNDMPDMADMADLFKNMTAGMKGPQKGTKPKVNESQIRKMAKVKQLRSKLHKQKLNEENIDED